MADEDQNIGLQDQDDEGMPPEMKEYGLAAFAHMAGVGPHPGEYKGPPRGKRPDVTETDLQRAHEESEGEEASSKKMRAAMTGQALGPSQFAQQQMKQAGAMQQLAGTLGQKQAVQAQAKQTPPNAPPAPSGPAGVTTPYPAQASPGAVPTTGNMQAKPNESAPEQ
jgi:hypothetical protein